MSIERGSSWVVVAVAGRVIADTRKALSLREAHYPAVQYIPRKDVDMAQLKRSDRTTYCPTRGTLPTTASPWAVSARSMRWSYETPYAAVAGIKDHVAFYTDRVDAIEIRS
jgi:uncharacterized protein (DUF427 family)